MRKLPRTALYIYQKILLLSSLNNTKAHINNEKDDKHRRHCFKVENYFVSLPSLREASGGSTRKKALDFEKGVGKTVVFPWRKAGNREVSQEQILFATGEGG
jgi:hypothetical protein